MHFSTVSILAFLATGAVATPVPSPNGDALQTANEAHLLARAGVPPQENPCTVGPESPPFCTLMARRKKKESNH